MNRHALFALAVSSAVLLAPAPGMPQEEKKSFDSRLFALAQDKQEDKADLKQRTERHKKDVTILRGLDFKTEVTVGVYSKKELLEFLKAEFEKELPREKAGRYQRGYAKFGLIPEDLDIYEAYMELFGSSIAGFYHPKTKELRLIRAGDGGDAEGDALKAAGIDMEAITLVHELTHAAQDQHYELSTLPLEDETNDDLIMALKGVIEGDASAVGWKYQFKDRFDLIIGGINKTYQSGMLPGNAGKLPAYLRLSLTFPYGYGTDFVVKYLKGTEGGLKDASRLFQDWPLSTEQILHPEKHFDKEKRDNPTLVTLPDLAKLFGAPWKESFHNVHGEFATEILLKEFRSDKLRLTAIRRAKEGWDGDRYVVLEDDKNRPMYVWYSTWDTEDDAREFNEAYALALEKKYEQAGPEGERGDKTTFSTPRGHVLVERRKADVLVLDGATEAMIGKAGEIWKAAKKTEMTGFERLKKFVCAKCDVKETFSGKCSKCGNALKYEDEKKDPKKRKEYSVER